MVSLTDIGPAKATVLIRGQELDIVGLTAENIAEILLQFPEIRRMLVQVDPGMDVINQLMLRIPDAINLVIAAACGVDLNDKEKREAACKAAANFTVGEQYLIIESMLKITFPQGMANFLAGVQGLFEQAGGARGWAPATTSHAQSNNASPQGEASETAGDQHQGN
jgi:hypothetical protein